MSPNSASNPLHNKLPLSPAERLRLYRRGLRVRRRSYQTCQITISGERIKGLVKRGYISPNEVDDVRAIGQAMNLFVWDAGKADQRKCDKVCHARPGRRVTIRGEFRRHRLPERRHRLRFQSSANLSPA